MKKYDIRKGDIVRMFHNLKDEQISKILKFNESNGRSLNPDSFKSLVSNKTLTFRVKAVRNTQKTGTEYAVLILNDRDLFLQSRYIKVLVRPPKHHLTKIFATK